MTTSIQNSNPAAPSTIWGVSGLIPGQPGVSRLSINVDRCSIGRGTDADIVLPSRNVSKKHAELQVMGSGVILRDLGSTNGTFVNGQRITEPTPVGAGDHLQFADVELCLYCESPSSALEYTCVAEQPELHWLLSRMNEVLHHRKISIHFQPIVLASQPEIFGYEALVRCSVPGLESPLALFKTATMLGEHCHLSRICREEAVAVMSQSNLTGALFLNTDPGEPLDSSLIDEMKQISATAKGRQLVLELHEAAVPHAREFREFVEALRCLDIKLAFDDFGVGQSRLLELAQVQPDFLKFDRSLVKDLGTPQAVHAHLVRNLHQSARELGITTLAEGLETAEAIAACRDIGFELFQGFAFGRPAPIDKLTAQSLI